MEKEIAGIFAEWEGRVELNIRKDKQSVSRLKIARVKLRNEFTKQFRAPMHRAGLL